MKTCIQTLGIMVIAASLSYGQDAPKPERKRPDPEVIFKKLDADGSGRVSLTEFKASPKAKKDETRAEEIFKKINADGNADGFTLEEFKAHLAKHAGKGGKGKCKKKGAAAGQ